MCGICGLLPLTPRAPEAAGAGPPPAWPALLRALSARLVHRGPDDAGELCTPQGALAARRLAIIDLAGGHQPLASEDGTVWVVLNGELYNYRALRRELAQQGHCFRTQSDTEVLVHAYEAWGTAMLDRLNGMFAFALLDRRTGTALLARDRTGIKPLYYCCTGCLPDRPPELVFASELQALLAHPAVPRTIDPVALAQYLVYEYVPAPRTILRGVQKLPPGHALLLREGRMLVWQYWDLDLARSERAETALAASGPCGEAHLAAVLRARLDAAVELELAADVPVGVLLSGGLDSSAVAAAMVRCRGRDVQSFSVAFDDPSFDESRYARLAATALGTQHHELVVQPADLLALIPQLPRLIDEPLADSSFVPTHLLARFVRAHVKVALGGDGGDELFAGYSTLQAHVLAEPLVRLLPRWLRRELLPALAARLPTSMDNLSLDFKLKRFTSGLALPPHARHQVWLGSFRPEEARALLGQASDDLAVPEDEPLAVAAAHLARCRATHLVNRLLYLDLKLYLEGDILPKVDRASMAASLEVRVPLLNRLVLDFVERLPVEYKLRGLTRKYLLRRAMAGRLPAAIINRPKKGFNMPVAKWLRGPVRPLLTDLLAPDALRAGGLFEPRLVERLVDAHLRGVRDQRKQLWTLLVFELWRRAVLSPSS
ncbi:MAG: asparagine synthase (glutamine-hydrolyzing) [Firmicutes bacterium]|nr:asparagine synthase (glutamine-hydrolyzing) [Bacillota bacterium]